MQAVWCVAKVSACSSCAATSQPIQAAPLAVMPMRSAMAPAHSTSQAGRLISGNQRAWVKNQAISTTTDTAHSRPMVLLA